MTAAPHASRAELPSLALPAIRELAEWRRWVLHRAKEPRTIRDTAASTTRAETWATFEEVAAAYVRGLGDGVGFVLTDTPFAGIDLDKCADSAGSVEPWAQAIVDRFLTYTERSTSGRGLHLIVRGALAGRGRKAGRIECYDAGRFFVMTGRHVVSTPETIEERGECLRAWVAEAFPSEAARAECFEPSAWDGTLPESVALAASEPTIRLLLRYRHHRLGYASESEADYALACTLAEARFPAGEIEAALRWRHRHVAPRPKSLDYWARTAANAIAATAAPRRGTR